MSPRNRKTTPEQVGTRFISIAEHVIGITATKSKDRMRLQSQRVTVLSCRNRKLDVIPK